MRKEGYIFLQILNNYFGVGGEEENNILIHALELQSFRTITISYLPFRTIMKIIFVPLPFRTILKNTLWPFRTICRSTHYDHFVPYHMPLFLFCAYDSSVLQNFKIFTHLLPNISHKDPRLTEVTYHCIIFNERVRKVPKI